MLCGLENGSWNGRLSKDTSSGWTRNDQLHAKPYPGKQARQAESHGANVEMLITDSFPTVHCHLPPSALREGFR